MAHGVSSPREGMVKNVSLESLQLCERDGKKPLEHTESDCKLDSFIYACFPLNNKFKGSVYFVHVYSCIERLEYCSNMTLHIDAEKIACHIYEKRNSETWQAAFVCAGSGISE